MYSYKTKGVCSREIQFDVENDIIKEVRFIGGCMGNTPVSYTHLTLPTNREV